MQQKVKTTKSIFFKYGVPNFILKRTFTELKNMSIMNNASQKFSILELFNVSK